MHMNNGRTADGEVSLQVRSAAAMEVDFKVGASSPDSIHVAMSLPPTRKALTTPTSNLLILIATLQTLTMTPIPPSTIKQYSQQRLNLTQH